MHHDVADSAAHVDEDRVLRQTGRLHDVVNERRHQFAVHGAGEGFVVLQALHVRTHAALVVLFDEAHEDLLGQFGPSVGVRHHGILRSGREGIRRGLRVFEFSQEVIDGREGLEEEGAVSEVDGAMQGAQEVGALRGWSTGIGI